MNFTYFKFLFITTIKKRPVWITWLLYLFTASAFLLILPAVARMNTLQVWANTTMAVCQTFLGMTVALFTAVLAIHIFKDGLEEGTELIVMSKPISRIKVTLTKIFIFAFFCLMVNVSSLIITVFTIFLPTTETKFYWGLIVSMFIGNLVAFGVFGSISILLSVKFAKVGVIITNIMISLIFLIYQCLTLFVFSIPIRSLSDHGMSAPSYITTNRNLDSGEYKEEEYVRFTTNVAKQLTEVTESERNHSKNWRETIKYWTDVICKNDPTLILNITDLAGQISLTYLSVGLNDYAFRQGHRMFAISRFYTYDLVSPSSPEIIEEIPNKKTLPWIYSGTTSYEEPIFGATIYSYPKTIGFAGIAPLGTTRLRGYGDQIPIGFYVKTGEALSSKDVFFEPEEWKKYKAPFELICDKVFEYELYENQVSSTVKESPWTWGSAWASNNSTLTRYYELLWSCFTGHSAEEKYFNDNFLKDYSKDYFDIKSISDLNERFLQFKYYTYYRVLREQQELFGQSSCSPEELTAKKNACDNEAFKLIESTLHLKHFDDNWMLQCDGNVSEIPSFIEPGTQTINVELINRTIEQLKTETNKKFNDGEITLEQKQSILRNSTYSKMRRTMTIFNNVSNTNEEFLFNSLDEPSRSAAYHGKSYMVTSDWIPYWETLLTPNGHNMQWFYYTSRETVQYWVYAVIWGAISLGLFSAGAIVYNKFDVK